MDQHFLHLGTNLRPQPRPLYPRGKNPWHTRAGLDDGENRKFLNLPGFELRLVGCPARRQSLYRLRYPGSYLHKIWDSEMEGRFSVRNGAPQAESSNIAVTE
jgi:hypothetical protein